MGIVGALVIARWSWGLVRDAGTVLLDYVPEGEDLPDEIREAILGQAWNADTRSFAESFGGKDIEAGLLLIGEVGFLKPEPATMLLWFNRFVDVCFLLDTILQFYVPFMGKGCLSLRIFRSSEYPTR